MAVVPALFVVEEGYYLLMSSGQPLVDSAIGHTRRSFPHGSLPAHHKAITRGSADVFVSGSPPGSSGHAGGFVSLTTGAVANAVLTADPVIDAGSSSDDLLTDSREWIQTNAAATVTQAFTLDPASLLPDWPVNLIGGDVNNTTSVWAVGGDTGDELLFLWPNHSGVPPVLDGSGLYQFGSDIGLGDHVSAADPLVLPGVGIDIAQQSFLYVLHTAGLSYINTSPIPATIGATYAASALVPGGTGYHPDLSDPSLVSMGFGAGGLWIAAPIVGTNRLGSSDSVFRLAIDPLGTADPVPVPLPPWDIERAVAGGRLPAITAVTLDLPVGIPWLRWKQRDDIERVYVPSASPGGIPSSGQKSERQGVHGTYW